MATRTGKARERVRCKVCGANLKPENLESHMERVHPEGRLTEESKQALQQRKRAKRQTRLTGVSRIALPAVGVAILLIVIYYLMAVYEEEPDPPPGWRLTDVQSDVVYDSDDYYEDGLTIVMFIHTKCYKCEDMAPILNDVLSKYEDRLSGMFSIGGYLFGTSNRDTRTTIADFQEEYDCQWPHLLDAKGTLKGEYGATDFFMLYLVKDNELVLEHAGKMSQSKLEQQIDRFI